MRKHGVTASCLRTKLANSVFTYALHEKLEAKKIPVRAVCAHPGRCVKFRQFAGHVMILLGSLEVLWHPKYHGCSPKSWAVSLKTVEFLALKRSQNCHFITLSWRGISPNFSESWMTEVVLTQILEVNSSPLNSPCMLGWDQGWMRLVHRLAKLANAPDLWKYYCPFSMYCVCCSFVWSHESNQVVGHTLRLYTMKLWCKAEM